VHDLHGGEGLEVDLGGGVPDRFEHVGVVGERQLGVQAANDVHLGRAGVAGVVRLLDDVVEAVLVCAVLPGLAVELAELAREDADVAVVQVPVDVVIGPVAVKARAGLVGQVAEGVQVAGAKESEAVFGGQALLVVDLLLDVLQGRVHM